MNSFPKLIQNYPILFIGVITVLTGLVGCLWPLMADVTLTEGALSSLQTISRLEGFGAGCIAGFGFSTATYIPMYKKKADQYDQLMIRLGEAALAERTI